MSSVARGRRPSVGLEGITRSRSAFDSRGTPSAVAARLTQLSTAAVKDADLVIEAVIENLKLKQDLFAKLDKVAKPSAIFATNTSSLLVGDVGASLPEARQKLFAGLHFFSREWAVGGRRCGTLLPMARDCSRSPDTPQPSPS